MILRSLGFALLGAVIGASTMFVYHAHSLSSAGVSITAVPLQTLLFDRMGLHGYALFGAVLGAFLAPLRRPGGSRLFTLGWIGIGVLGAGLTALAWALLGSGRVPTASQGIASLSGHASLLVAGVLIAVLLAALQMAYEYLEEARVRRELAASRTAADADRDVDGMIRAYWEEKAEHYMAERKRLRDGRAPV